MKTEQQLADWFRSNGIDIDVPFPMPLVDGLCKKALVFDHNLFRILDKSFRPVKKNMLVLNFNSWGDLFSYYRSYTNN